MPRKLHVAMDDLFDAMEERSDFVVPYFNQRTGEVDTWVESLEAEGQLDPEDPDWVEVPRVEARDAFPMMQGFVDGIDELDVKRRLQRALEGQGAFRRFRETLAEYPDLRSQWESTQREDLLQRALAFLAGLDIDPTYELRAQRVAADGEPTKPKEPRIQLHHLLLLGSPNGKTELLDGRVHRYIQAKSQAQARKLFEHFAREIVELQGLGWRRSLVDGQQSVEFGPFRLWIERDSVWLATQVPRAIWDAFR
ncbi:MAG TPA: UPF0158 family protein [Planctomycetota bacterium]